MQKLWKKRKIQHKLHVFTVVKLQDCFDKFCQIIAVFFFQLTNISANILTIKPSSKLFV